MLFKVKILHSNAYFSNYKKIKMNSVCRKTTIIKPKKSRKDMRKGRNY